MDFVLSQRVGFTPDQWSVLLRSRRLQVGSQVWKWVHTQDKAEAIKAALRDDDPDLLLRLPLSREDMIGSIEEGIRLEATRVLRALFQRWRPSFSLWRPLLRIEPNTFSWLRWVDTAGHETEVWVESGGKALEPSWLSTPTPTNLPDLPRPLLETLFQKCLEPGREPQALALLRKHPDLIHTLCQESNDDTPP